MIIEFSVENFGSIRDRQTLSFEATRAEDLAEHYLLEGTGELRLLKMAMIYGANASGKTTILKALDFLRDLVAKPAEKKSDELSFEPFLFDSQSRFKTSFITIDFLQNNTRYAYGIEFTKHAVISEQLSFYNPRLTNIYKRTTDLDQQYTEITFGGKIKKDKILERQLSANTLWNNSVLGGFLKTNMEHQELTSVNSWFFDYLSPIILSSSELDSYVTNNINTGTISKDHVVSILKKADFQISDVLIKDEERDLPEGLLDFLEETTKTPKEQIERLRKKGKINRRSLELEHTVNGDRYTLPFEKESEGTKRYYGFAGILALAMKESTSFSVDELECSLHPDLYAHFILSFIMNVKKSQLLFTTHNRELLGKRDIFRNDVIWFADKDESCSTEIYSLADFDSSVIRDTSSVYNAYKIGKLGGVPNLGDYYINLDNEGE